MLKLKTVTLLGIDSHHPDKTLRSLIFSKRFVDFAEVVFVTDLNFPDIQSKANHHGIRLVHHTTTTREDHEYSSIEKMPEYFTTPHVIYTEWDGAVANPQAWEDRWLEHDFIGAPWPIGAKGAEPPSDETNNVGNGGFSLRSKRFCQAVSQRVHQTKGKMLGTILMSDAWMCRTLRPELQKLGMYYAPVFRAACFSCEDRIYSGQFGLHGKATMAINGFDWLKV